MIFKLIEKLFEVAEWIDGFSKVPRILMQTLYEMLLIGVTLTVVFLFGKGIAAITILVISQGSLAYNITYLTALVYAVIVITRLTLTKR